MHFATIGLFSGMQLKLKERHISNNHNRLKNPNWREADQFSIYKHDQDVELESTKKRIVRAGLETATFGEFPVPTARLNTSAVLPL